MRKLTLLGLMTAGLSGIPSCSEKSTTTTENSNTETTKREYKHVVFKALCRDESENRDRGLVLTVMIFDEASNNRIELGGTGSNGGYCSIKLDISGSYRIELFEYINNQRKCVAQIKNFNYNNYPSYWSDNCDAGYSGSAPILYGFESCYNISAINGCWCQ